MNAGSLCSGIEGIGLGLAAHDIRLAWHSEIEQAPADLHARYWPDCPNIGDLKTVDWSKLEPGRPVDRRIPLPAVLVGRAPERNR